MPARHRLGDALRRAREAAGLQQQEAADRLRVHPVTVSNWERGKNTPRDDVLVQIATLYRTTPAALRYGSAGGAADGGESADASHGEEPRTAEWWSGYQAAMLETMRHAAQLTDQAAAMQRQAITAQQAIQAGTTLTPKVGPDDRPPAADPGPGHAEAPPTAEERAAARATAKPARAAGRGRHA